jgi:hypothetical protein
MHTYEIYAHEMHTHDHTTMSTPNPYYGQNAAVLLSRTYVFAAFGGPGVAFLILR